MIDHTQATFSTLSTLRVEAEELIKATNEYINKGLEQVREGECLKEQIVASINKNDEVFEDMVQIAYPDAGLDNESNRAEDVSITPRVFWSS